MQDFYLVSTELREPYAPQACRVVRRLRSELRDDLALVELEPPLPRHVYDTNKEVQWLILASRLQGESLFPATKWPLQVYICRLKGKDKPGSDTIASVDIAIVDRGEVRRSPL
jgi:hypothetical protein